MRQRSLRRLRLVSVCLVLFLLGYLFAPLPGIRPAAYAADDPPPLPVPEDPLGAQTEGAHPEISIDVDRRDGHLIARVVDNWGPGKTPFLVRTHNNATPASDTSAAGSWHLNQILEIRQSEEARLSLRESDGTLPTYKKTGTRTSGSDKFYIYTQENAAYLTIETKVTERYVGGELEITWSGVYTQYLPKGATRTFTGSTSVNTPPSWAGIMEARDANSNVTTYVWAKPAGDAHHTYLQTVTDPIARVTTYGYERSTCAEYGDAPAKQPGPQPLAPCIAWYYRVKTITDPYGRTVTFIYGTANLTQVQNAAGAVSSYTYHSQARLASLTNPRGCTYSFTWERKPGPNDPYRVTRVTASDSAQTTYAYALEGDGGMRTTVTTARGYATVYRHSPVNQQTGAGGDLLSVTDPLGYLTSYTYDTKHNVTQVTNARGYRTTYTYNSRNKVTEVVQDPGGLALTSSLTWDSNDNLLSVTNPRGIVAAYQYDSKHNLIRVTRAQGTPAQAVTQYTYTTWGGVASVIDPRGKTTGFTYDARRRLVTVTPPAGGTTTYGYDTLDNRTSMTNGNGRTWAYTYDASRNLLTETDPLGYAAAYQYDAAGNRTRVTDPKGYATVFTYDSRDRITGITDPLSQATTYQYDPVGNLSRITNARGYATNFTYDALDRLSGVTDALGQGTTYQYDQVGNRTQMVDRKGQVFTYTYDAVNRLTQVQVGTTIFSYTYDAAGNRLTLVDGTGTTAFQYDELDRLTRITYPDSKTVQYGYDAAGNRMSLINPGTVTFTYAYDNANRLTGITQGSRTWTFGYDLAGNRTSLAHPNNASITYAYLQNNWLGTLTHRRGDGTLIETITYGYDQNGNRTTLTDYTGSTVFGYDQLNRLTSAAYPGTYGTWAWTYDPVGNRITQNSPSGQTNYAYDANNRLTSVTGKTYSYDPNGNLTGISDGTSFTYDAHNRMSQATLPGGLVVQYTYNGHGLKIRRIEGSVVTRYYHDGIRPIYESDSAGGLKAQLERDIFGNLLARQDAGGARYYYHHDGLGSTVGLTDASGQLVVQRTYDSWGNLRTSSGSAPGNYQFTGAELDPASGLYHMGARFYDPTIGRWLSEDPVEDSYFDPRTLNFYTYAYNNPVLLIDPDGLRPCMDSTNACGGRIVRSWGSSRTVGFWRANFYALTAQAVGVGLIALTGAASVLPPALRAAISSAIALMAGAAVRWLDSISLKQGWRVLEVWTVIDNGDGTYTLELKVTVLDEKGNVVRERAWYIRVMCPPGERGCGG